MAHKDIIPLEIRNHLNLPAGVLILNAPFNPNNQANATKYYEYDLSTETFVGVTTVTLFYFLAGSLNPLSISAPISNGNLTTLTNILTGFNLGLWFTSGNLVYTYNDNYVFDKLDLT